VSTHLGASPGDIAPTVLMPGDPLRAKWIAETFLEDARCYTEVRGMLGFTGTWHGRPVSVQGSGMGQPSMAIYVHELFTSYDVQSVVRVGSCGALAESLAIRDIVIASGACTNSGVNRITFEGLDYAPVADFGLLRAAVEAAEQRGTDVHVGLLFATDSFYNERPELVTRMADYGVLAVDMESSALYTLAAKHGRRALTICTVSDHIVTGEETFASELELNFGELVVIAMGVALGGGADFLLPALAVNQRV
jgi:purine-nucleoside phosphorylase